MGLATLDTWLAITGSDFVSNVFALGLFGLSLYFIELGVVKHFYAIILTWVTLGLATMG